MGVENGRRKLMQTPFSTVDGRVFNTFNHPYFSPPSFNQIFVGSENRIPGAGALSTRVTLRDNSVRGKTFEAVRQVLVESRS
jgi:hypothetical protein